MTLLSKIRVGLLSALVLSTSFTALPAQAQPTPHAAIPSILASDLVAFDSDGRLWSYRWGGGDGWDRVQVGTGWNSMRDLKIVDWNQDQVQDIIAVGDNGNLYLYYGKETGGFSSRIIGSGWTSYDLEIGHWKETDQYPSIIAANVTNGILYNYPNPSGAALGPRVVEGRGWGSSLAHHMTEFDGDGKADILANQKSTGNLVLYRTDGDGNFIPEPRRVVGKGWTAMNEVLAISGYGGDHMICNCPAEYTQPGLLARTHAGILYYYEFMNGTWSPRDRVGPGWNNYTIAGTESPRRFSF